MKRAVSFILKIIVILICFLPIGSQAQDTIHRAITVVQADSLITAYNGNPDFVIIDLRQPSYYSTSHIQNAINMDYYGGTFWTDIYAMDHSKAYLLYCASGGRSTTTYNAMVADHFREVYNMLGGITAWISGGYPVVNGSTGFADYTSVPTHVFPNPATDKLYIQSDGFSSFELIDISGKILAQQAFDSPLIEVDISGFSNGSYYLRLQGGEIPFQTFVIVNR
jgi:rhodanese-related sulfurtransferase